jgi:N-acetylmuramic acid 6-phosphate etherase
MVQGVIAGGSSAVSDSVEGAEDDPEAGANDLRDRAIGPQDVVVGIAASGRTPYVVGALRFARSAGALAIAVVNVSPAALESESDITITAVTGAESIMGSTRLKAGTAQKMILNLLSTGAMVRLGKTYGNLMVDVCASNAKLQDRAIRIVMAGAASDEAAARQALESAGWSAKTAIVMLRNDLTASAADILLASKDGFVRRALHDGPAG